MPIEQPLRSSRYKTGGLIQQCNVCHWAQRGHCEELHVCPACAAKLEFPLAIAFGGAALKHMGRKVEIVDVTGGRVLLQEADIEDIVSFLCRHGKQWPGERDPATGEQARQITFRAFMEDHFFPD